MKLRHYLSIMLALAVLAGAGATVYLRDSAEFGAMEVRAVRGDVSIHRGNEVIPVGTTGEAVEPQDVVVTGKAATAQLNLEGGDARKLTLDANTRLRIKSDTVVEAQEGSLVAEATDAPMEVLFDDVSAGLSSGKLRIDRGFGTARAASFGGRVRLESAGEQRVELTKLHQVDVAAGDLPEAAVPYRLDLGDALDRKFLGRVVTLTQDLDLLAKGFARQVGSARPGLDYFGALSNSNVSFMDRYLSRSVSDLLVAFTIAENDPDGSLKGTFVDAFDLFDQGASYGVTAAILDVRGAPLVAQLERLIVDTGAVAADGGAGEATFALGSEGSSSGTGTTDTGSTGSAGGETVSGGVEGETVENVDDCSNVVDCGVQDVQDEIDPDPAPGPNTGPEEEEEDPDGGLLTGGGGDSDGGLLDTGELLGGGK